MPRSIRLDPLFAFWLCACSSTTSVNSKVCASDADCRGSSWGPVCIRDRCNRPPLCGAGLVACVDTCVDTQRDVAN